MRAYLRVTGLASLLLSLGVAHPNVNSPSEWVQFRLNGFNNAVLSGDLETAWLVGTDGGFSSSPALVDGTLYIGNNAGSLYAINVATGKTLWRFFAKAPLMSNPLVTGDLVIVGEGNQNSHTSGDDGPAMEEVGTGENAIIAIGRRDGKERWRVTMDGSAMPTPAIVKGILVHHGGSGLLAGIDPAHGTVVYSRDLKSIASMSAALPIDGERFVSAGQTQNSVFAFNARDGSTAWSARLPLRASGVGDCPPAGDGTRVFCDYVMPPDGYNQTGVGQLATQHVYALSSSDGRMLWDVATESGTVPPWNEASIPLVDHAILFAGSSLAPWMHAFDTANGRMLWRTPVRGVVKGGVVAKDGVIYFGDLSGYIWALEEQTGRVVGSKRFNTSFNVGSPIIAGKTLIIGSNTGQIIATPLSAIRSAKDS
jgi:eukaryotic-like serine/threonine-protein kinase